VTAERVMAATRGRGFGDEVKRRIILGTYALSAGYYDAYYGKAQKVRTLVQRDFADAFRQADVLVSPSVPTIAFKVGERINDLMAMYLNDVATIPANLAGIPGISVPNGLHDEMPTGFQILAPATQDAVMYRVGAALEYLLETRWGAPLISTAPDIASEQPLGTKPPAGAPGEAAA
jgi:aspartyl-tRNA(Asn)/glutamyl-tRNA(Gln) amidotransferase subunit A